MSPDEFKAKHGEQWIRFISEPIGKDFLQLIEDQQPAREIPSGDANANMRLAGAPVLLNEIVGYERLARIIRNIAITPEKPKQEPPDTWQNPEV